MGIQELDELLGAYALDAVDDDERAEIERYLAFEPRARAEVAEHREVATMLAFSGAVAPTDLWDRISGQLTERAPAPGPELAKVLPMSPRRRWASRLGAPVLAGVAAAAVALGVVAIAARGGDKTPLAQAVESARSDRDSVVVTLRSADGNAGSEAIIDADGHGYLIGNDLPAVRDDQSYQLWGVVNDEVISLGVFSNQPETEVFSVDGDVSALVLTVEERGGVPVSAQPAAYSAEVA